VAEMKTVVIIQARMGSSRLPGKVLMPLGGKPSVQQVIERARLIRGVDEVVLATSTASIDDPLVAFCNSAGVPVVRGSEDDVLDRYYQAAKAARADVVIRITGDCPLLDPVESAKVLEAFRSSGADYVSNVHPPTLPDGLDTEVFCFQALETAWKQATKKSEREHVTLFISTNPELFRIESISNPVDWSGHRWTLDEERDYRMLSAVYDELALRGEFGTLAEVINILRDRPEIARLNGSIERNEGLKKSQQEDE